jgi:hypothetical protein
VGATTEFSDISQLLGFYSYKQRPPGDVVSVWYIDGREMGRGRQAIKAGNGSAWFGYRREDGTGLRPGTYRLTLSINGKPRRTTSHLASRLAISG